MRFIKFMKSIDEKTNGDFFLLISILTLLSSSIIMVLTNTTFLGKPTDPWFLSILNWVIQLLINTTILLIIISTYEIAKRFYKWLNRDLKYAVKSSLEETYNVSSDNKSKIRFK